MVVGVPLESRPDERRVAVVPAVLPLLKKAGLEVLLERGAGARAGFADETYGAQGAALAPDRAQLLAKADVLVGLHRPDPLDGLRAGQVVIGLLDPLGGAEAMRALAGTGATAFALELLPRISRAQPMDALTSMATIAGYKAVLLAAAALNKIFPLMMTAAGTITPARVFVVGAGVAGLQAIATARRLGGVVSAYDVRPAVKEQVESLGARFVEMEIPTEGAEGTGGYARAMDEEFYRRQRELMAKVVAESDVVVSTAAIPGAKAPTLIDEAAVRGMQPGAVIVDLAAEWGGNCVLTRPGETVDAGGVAILGPVNLASTVPYHASQMYARNILAFLKNLMKDGALRIDREDEIVRDALVTENGEVVNPRVRERLGLGAAASGRTS